MIVRGNALASLSLPCLGYEPFHLGASAFVGEWRWVKDLTVLDRFQGGKQPPLFFKSFFFERLNCFKLDVHWDEGSKPRVPFWGWESHRQSVVYLKANMGSSQWGSSVRVTAPCCPARVELVVWQVV